PGGGIPAFVPRGDEVPRQDRREPDRRAGDRGPERPHPGEVRGDLPDALEEQDGRGADGGGLPAAEPGRRPAVGGRGAAADLPEGDRLARLQVQLGGAGGLHVHRPAVAGPVPGREPVLAEGLRQPGLAARRPHPRGPRVTASERFGANRRPFTPTVRSTVGVNGRRFAWFRYRTQSLSPGARAWGRIVSCPPPPSSRSSTPSSRAPTTTGRGWSTPPSSTRPATRPTPRRPNSPGSRSRWRSCPRTPPAGRNWPTVRTS